MVGHSIIIDGAHSGILRSMAVKALSGSRRPSPRDLVQLHAVVDPLFDQNCYILRRRDSDRCLVIDPGLQAQAALRLMEDAGLSCDRILVSHGHPDHVAGIPAVKAAHGCPAAMHALDRPLLGEAGVLPGFPAPPQASVVDEDLSAGQVIGWQELEIAVIHTPGHTPGSVCFLVGTDLLSGDTLLRRSIGRTDLPGASPDTLLMSIRDRLYTLRPETVVHPGHGTATTIAEEMRSNPFVAARR